MSDELVYLLQGGPYYKIGRTKNLMKRIKVIQTGHPYPLRVIQTWQVENAVEVEGYLHRKYASVKMQGEWFQLSTDELELLVVVKEWHIEKPQKQTRPRLTQPHCSAHEGSLRQLLEEKSGIHSSTELRERIGGSAAQISNLWAGRDTMGARLMLRILKAFPEITIDDLAQVDEAKKALEPPKTPKSRRRPSSESREEDPPTP